MRTVDHEEHARRLVAYERTANDADAAAALGLQVVTFRAWRKGQGLQAKQSGKPRRPNGRRPRVAIPAAAVRATARRRLDAELENIRRFIPR